MGATSSFRFEPWTSLTFFFCPLIQKAHFKVTGWQVLPLQKPLPWTVCLQSCEGVSGGSRGRSGPVHEKPFSVPSWASSVDW